MAVGGRSTGIAWMAVGRAIILLRPNLPLAFCCGAIVTLAAAPARGAWDRSFQFGRRWPFFWVEKVSSIAGLHPGLVGIGNDGVEKFAGKL